MALTQKQLKDVCMIWGGHGQCRYLDEDQDDKGQMVSICRKLSPNKQIIDDEVDIFYQEMQKNGQDPASQGVALADNCQGYIVLKSKQQGYDVKN